MNLRMKFGLQEVEIELSDRHAINMLRTPGEHLATSEAEIINKALESPVGCPALEELVRPQDHVAIIVPDKTRKCKVHVVLPILLEKLEKRGVKPKNISLLFANGTHSQQTETQKKSILGETVYQRYISYENDARNESEFTALGKTNRGTPVTIRQDVANADTVLVVSEVIHHYFAGFGGGAKMVMPGVAAYHSIVQNHRLTLTEDGDFHPLCFDGNLEGNPVYEDIVDAAQYYPPVFFMGVLLNEDGEIFHASAGDLIQAHRVVASTADDYYSIPVRELADMVVVSAGGYPRDVNFLQTHKSIHHAHYAVKQGGVILCVAECAEGVGSESLLDWFRFSDRKEMTYSLLNQYTLHGHTALSLRKKLDTAHVVLLSTLPSELVTRMGLLPTSTPTEAIRVAESFLPSPYKCYVLEEGGRSLPRHLTD